MPGFLSPPPLPVRVSVDSRDTLNIPGSFMDAWLPTPLSEYPWIPWYSEHHWIIHGHLASYSPPCQSIRGFPGYSEHPWIIHGCLASYPPPPPPLPVRVSVDSRDTLNIPGSFMDAWLPTPLSEYPWIPWYSEHHWIIHGCLASYPPCVRVSMDSLPWIL